MEPSQPPATNPTTPAHAASVAHPATSSLPEIVPGAATKKASTKQIHQPNKPRLTVFARRKKKRIAPTLAIAKMPESAFRCPSASTASTRSTVVYPIRERQGERRDLNDPVTVSSCRGPRP
jgi:hypothetical protein